MRWRTLAMWDITKATRPASMVRAHATFMNMVILVCLRHCVLSEWGTVHCNDLFGWTRSLFDWLIDYMASDFNYNIGHVSEYADLCTALIERPPRDGTRRLARLMSRISGDERPGATCQSCGPGPKVKATTHYCSTRKIKILCPRKHLYKHSILNMIRNKWTWLF